ncbi:MAG: response regulator [Desulfamplus sp.]|nr:response regulator [Desulfamplus sp.]
MMDNMLEPPKILIVDDIPENLFALEKILGTLDAVIIRASSGNEALALVLEHDFALIILDVQMPEMDGYEVAEILKYDEDTGRIPIIFVTAIDRDSTKELKGYGTGAVDFIFKPLNKSILISKVKVFLELHQIKTGLERIVEERTLELRVSNQELKGQIKKNAEASREIERGRAYLSRIINAISSALISVDKGIRITDMNMEARRLSGFTLDDPGQKPFSEIFPFYTMLVKNISESMEANRNIERSKVPVYIKGRLMICNFAIYPFEFNDSKGAVIRVDDVTEIVKMDEMMIHSEKMLSMGGIAAGMAHEINNPLSAIIQNVQVIQNRILKDMPANNEAAGECNISLGAMRSYMEKRGILRMLEAVQQSGTRAARIVDDMLSFSRKNQGEATEQDICRLMDKSVKIALNDYEINAPNPKEHPVTINRSYQEDMPRLHCQAGKIQQVIVNIIKNSLQAMERKAYPDGEQREIGIAIKTLSGGDMACIELRDNGPGMSDAVRKKIFEPFFTTNKSGTGLGLSISYFIITEDHKGHISVESKPGKGAAFTIKLPVSL